MEARRATSRPYGAKLAARHRAGFGYEGSGAPTGRCKARRRGGPVTVDDGSHSVYGASVKEGGRRRSSCQSISGRPATSALSICMALRASSPVTRTDPRAAAPGGAISRPALRRRLKELGLARPIRVELEVSSATLRRSGGTVPESPTQGCGGASTTVQPVLPKGACPGRGISKKV